MLQYKSVLYLKTQCCSNIFLLANAFIIFVSIDCSFFVIGSYGLNPNLVLNSAAVGTVEYIIILKQDLHECIYLSSHQKNLFHIFCIF